MEMRTDFLPVLFLFLASAEIPVRSAIGSITPHCSHQLFVLNEMRHPQLAAQLASCQRRAGASAAAGSLQGAGAFFQPRPWPHCRQMSGRLGAGVGWGVGGEGCGSQSFYILHYSDQASLESLACVGLPVPRS